MARLLHVTRKMHMYSRRYTRIQNQKNAIIPTKKKRDCKKHGYVVACHTNYVYVRTQIPKHLREKKTHPLSHTRHPPRDCQKTCPHGFIGICLETKFLQVISRFCATLSAIAFPTKHSHMVPSVFV